MKVKFKSYDDLKALMTASKNAPTPEQNKEFNDVINKDNYSGYCKDMDAFLKYIAGKTFSVQDFQVIKGKKYFNISTAEVGADGGFNTNMPFDTFGFSEDYCETIDFEGKTYWYCFNCGQLVQPEEQKSYFDPKKTLAEVGIDNAVCPLCFTRTFKEVKA